MNGEYRFQQFHIPDRMMGAVRRYIEDGTPPGDFLTAVIRNDLKEACGRADEENIGNLPAYVAYFYNEAPASCWGSPEKMRDWMVSFEAKAEKNPNPGIVLDTGQEIKAADAVAKKMNLRGSGAEKG